MPDDLQLDPNPGHARANEDGELTNEDDGMSVLDDESAASITASGAGIILGDQPPDDGDLGSEIVEGDSKADEKTGDAESLSSDEGEKATGTDVEQNEANGPPESYSVEGEVLKAAEEPVRFAWQASGAPRRTVGRPVPATVAARHVPGEPLSQGWDSVQKGLRLVSRGTWVAVLAALAWLGYLALDDAWILERLPQAAPYATPEVRLGLVIAAGCLLGLAGLLCLIGAGHCCSVPRRHARVAAFRAMTFLCGTVVEVGGVVAIAVFFDSPILLLFTYVCTLAAGLLAAFFFMVFERRVSHFFHANRLVRFIGVLILAAVMLCGATGYWLLQPPPDFIPAEYLRWVPYVGPSATLFLLLWFAVATGGLRRAIRRAAATSAQPPNV